MYSEEQRKEHEQIMNEYHEFLKSNTQVCELVLIAANLKETSWGRTLLEWCLEIVESSRGSGYHVQGN